MAIPFSVRSYLAEPAVPHPPSRLRRDWVLVGGAAVVAVAEAALRTDAEWSALAPGWRVASLAAVLAGLPALLVRRTRPLLATAWAFGLALVAGVAAAVAGHGQTGLFSGAVLLVTAYALYRWGSGRDGAIGAGILLAAWAMGTITGAQNLSDVIGGFIVLCVPVEIGLTVRYRRAARERAIAEATARERAELARELHDTIAHHMSAIAVQAQAGRAVAATDPERAVAVLAVIEATAKEALGEMRSIVRVWRGGAEPELAPRQGLAELGQLARHRPGEPAVEVTVDERLGPVDPAVGMALYRIAQESVTNAVRHARRASRVEVRVVPDGDHVRLTVADDGRGAGAIARADGTAGAEGYGLLGMAERAQLLGGRFTAGPAAAVADPSGGGTRPEIAPATGGGWLVTAVLPCRVAGGPARAAGGSTAGTSGADPLPAPSPASSP